MDLENCYVITGGMGFGKTSIVEHLEQKGYTVVPELAKILIDEELPKNGDLLPWEDNVGFQRELLQRTLDVRSGLPREELTFSDRGIPDAVAFLRAEGITVPSWLRQACRNHTYGRKVFIVPPWRDIFENRPARPQSFEEAARVGRLVEEVYENLGYEIVQVPKVSIPERADFVLRNVET